MRGVVNSGTEAGDQAGQTYMFPLHHPTNAEPLLTVLNFSAGTQSSMLLWEILLGEVERPKNFWVLSADPGMENSKSYEYAAMMREKCEGAGIDWHVAEGPNLLHDLLTSEDKTRLDNPPYWTDNGGGEAGQLAQKCTQHYKIAPMDRAIRQRLEVQFGINRRSPQLPVGCVEKWIGIALDERMRMKPPSQRYVQFRYPLVDRRITKADVENWYGSHNIDPPPRSVCNACFANGRDTFKEMAAQRPADFAQAVAVDNAVRDSRHLGITNPVYVSRTLVSLEQLERDGFAVSNGEGSEGMSCDSGYCFT